MTPDHTQWNKKIPQAHPEVVEIFGMLRLGVDPPLSHIGTMETNSAQPKPFFNNSKAETNALKIKENSDRTERKDGDREDSEKLKEIGGPAGLEPTRFGDWERNGRCSDF